MAVKEMEEHLVVEIMVRDIMRSLAVYSALGFTVERRDANFAALRWGDRRLFLDQRSDLKSLSEPSRANVRILTNDVEGVWEIAAKLGLRVERPIADRYYGLRDFTVLDPDGFGLRFAQPLTVKTDVPSS